MKKEKKDMLWVVVIGFAVMFALPAAYRVWIHYNPPPQRRPLSVFLFLPVPLHLPCSSAG